MPERLRLDSGWLFDSIQSAAQCVSRLHLDRNFELSSEDWQRIQSWIVHDMRFDQRLANVISLERSER